MPGRQLGARDLRKRKTRKDKGKKRKKYKGKSIIRFRKKQGRKTELKVQIKSIDPMSRDGFHHWAKHIRPIIKRVVYAKTFIRSFTIPVSNLSTKENVEETMLNLIEQEGDFQMLGYSGSLRSYKGVKPVEMCRFRITDHLEGLRCNMYLNKRLFRYWFWNKK